MITRASGRTFLVRPEGTALSKPRAETRRVYEPWRSPGLRGQPILFLSLQSSPKGTALIPGVLFVQFQSVTPIKFRGTHHIQCAPLSSATLWLRVFVVAYPGRRQRSLRSRFLALRFDRDVASRLKSSNTFHIRRNRPEIRHWADPPETAATSHRRRCSSRASLRERLGRPDQ